MLLLERIIPQILSISWLMFCSLLLLWKQKNYGDNSDLACHFFMTIVAFLLNVLVLAQKLVGEKPAYVEYTNMCT